MTDHARELAQKLVDDLRLAMSLEIAIEVMRDPRAEPLLADAIKRINERNEKTREAT